MRIPVKLDNGGVFFVDAEVAPVPPGDSSLRPTGAAMGRDVLDSDAEGRFARAVEVVRGIAGELTAGLLAAGNAHPPTHIELELKLGFDAGGNVWIFHGSAEASLTLQLKWYPPDSDDE
jgi:hypothetical protein